MPDESGNYEVCTERIEQNKLYAAFSRNYQGYYLRNHLLLFEASDIFPAITGFKQDFFRMLTALRRGHSNVSWHLAQ